MKKTAAIITALTVSMTMLGTIPASAKSVKLSKAKITKLQSTKPSNLKIKIKKVKKVSGYKVKVAQNKKFKKSKTYKIKKNQKTISGLKQGEKYFIKVRAYKKIKVKGKSKIVYGKWSKVKSIRIKVSEESNNEEKPVKIDEKTKEQIGQIEELSGIILSNSVRFLNYSYVERIYENYDNAIGYYIFAKLQIKETELNAIVSNYHKRDKEFIPYGLGRMNEYCDWWDLKISDIKDSYCQLYVKRLSDDYIIRSANREIVVTNEYAGNGYLTVYLVLQ